MTGIGLPHYLTIAAILFTLSGCESTVSRDKKYRKGGGSDTLPMAVKMRRSTNRGF